MIAQNCDRIESEERNNLKNSESCQLYCQFSLLNLSGRESLCNIIKSRLLSSFCHRTGLWVRCPRSLPSRKVSDESLGRDEMSCVRLATNNISSQIIVSFIVKCYIIIQSSSPPDFGLVKQPQGTSRMFRYSF